MLLPLDGPGVYGVITVTTTPQEVKVGSSALDERKVLTIQPTDGHIYYGYSNTVSSTTGTKIHKGQWIQLEASDRLPVWVVSQGSVNVRITEVS